MHSRCPSHLLLSTPPSLQRFSYLNLRLITAGFLVGVMLCATAGFARAQNVPSFGPNPAAERLTQDLVALNARHHRASPAEQARLLSNLLTTAADRQQLLASLIEDNPGEVLRVALPAAIRASLPPAVQAYVEEAVEVEGKLEVMYEDRESESRLLFFLEAAGERLSLHFAADPPTHLLTGAQVRVKGVQVDEALALASGDTSIETLALNSSSTNTATTATSAAPPNTFGAQKTLVILVNFQDKPTQQPWTLDQVRSVVFGTVSNFFLENSYQQTWLSGDVFGWYTIPLDSTVCDQLGIASYAESAATAAGVNLSAYTRYVYVFPNTSSCQWSGTSTVGGNPSQTWINGYLQLDVVGHELGHSLGLHHSHSLVCQGATIGTNCTSLEYGDGIDIMGWSPSAHFNAFMKEFLGWLNYNVSPPITTVQTSGTYVLDPYEPTGTNPKALKILKGTDPTTGKEIWYYVEYRQAIGFDSIIASSSSLMNGSNILNGVVIHTGSPDESSNTSYLLDMTPETYDLYTRDPALDVGKSFSDPEAGVTITTVSVGSTGAAVSVTLTPACTRAKPTVVVSPSQSQWVQAGTAVTYTVSVTNNDNTNCSTTGFTLQATVPSGWTAAFGTPTLTLSPGVSASTTLMVTSPASAADGSYTLNATATNSTNTAYTASASATYVIVSSLKVTVSTDKASYTRNQTVSSTTKVSAGGSPVANANVTFTITKSNGTVVTKTATTGTDGSAVFTFKIKPNDPVGVYQVRADATNKALSGSATTSFTVQ